MEMIRFYHELETKNQVLLEKTRHYRAILQELRGAGFLGSGEDTVAKSLEVADMLEEALIAAAKEREELVKKGGVLL